MAIRVNHPAHHEHFSQYFEYLGFLHLSAPHECHRSSFKAQKSGSLLNFCNRVLINDDFSSRDLRKINDFYGQLPFTLWIPDLCTHALALVRAHNLNHVATYPLMSLAHDRLDPNPVQVNLEIKELSADNDNLSTWVSVVARAYKINEGEFKKYIDYLQACPKASEMKFYLGFYDHKPIAASMLIRRGSLADLHWVGVLPDYRHQGFGEAITHFPLQEATLDHTILYASLMGEPIYRKMGFKTIAHASIYKTT